MIHVSTDYVFSGAFDGAPRPYDIDDATGPLSVYGKTKLAGEQAVHEVLPDAHVVRTAWVYTGVGSDFVGVMRRLAAGDGPVNVVADQIGSPTYVADLVSALLRDRRPATPRRRCCTSPTRARPAGSSRRGPCSRGSGPTPNGCRPVSSEDAPRPAAAAAVFGAVRPRRRRPRA